MLPNNPKSVWRYKCTDSWKNNKSFCENQALLIKKNPIPHSKSPIGCSVVPGSVQVPENRDPWAKIFQNRTRNPHTIWVSSRTRTGTAKAWIFLECQLPWMCVRLKSKEPPQTFVPKIWYLGISNLPFARVFLNLNQSIEHRIENFQLEKCRYITDIKIKFWDTAQYFHSKKLK